MIIISKNGRTVTLYPTKVERDTVTIDLHFPAQTLSWEAYNKIRDIGVKCWHADKNAPCGPCVMLSNKDDYGMRNV